MSPTHAEAALCTHAVFRIRSAGAERAGRSCGPAAGVTCTDLSCRADCTGDLLIGLRQVSSARQRGLVGVLVSRRRSWGSDVPSQRCSRSGCRGVSCPFGPTCLFRRRLAPVVFTGGPNDLALGRRHERTCRTGRSIERPSMSGWASGLHLPRAVRVAPIRPGGPLLPWAFPLAGLWTRDQDHLVRRTTAHAIITGPRPPLPAPFRSWV